MKYSKSQIEFSSTGFSGKPQTYSFKFMKNPGIL